MKTVVNYDNSSTWLMKQACYIKLKEEKQILAKSNSLLHDINKDREVNIFTFFDAIYGVSIGKLLA